MNPRIRKFLRDEWLQLFLLVVPMIAALAAMPFATERVPMQWNLRGQVNWYAPKEWGLLVLPVAMLMTISLVFFLEGRDRNRRKPEDGSLTSHGKATRAIRLAISILLAAVGFIQIASALGRHLDVARLVPTGVGLLIAFTGNLFGKLKPNRYVGIRVPWTLRSEAVWRKTHRVTGWIYTVAGLIVAVVSLVSPTRYSWGTSIDLLAVIVVFFVVPLVVAWQAARAERLEGAAQGKSAVFLGGRMIWIEAAMLVALLAMYLHHVASDPKHAPERKAAQAAAERWLVHLDESRYEDAWRATGSSFRKVVPQPKEVKSLNQYRKPLGAKLSRSLREASYKESLPDAPPGKYVVGRFDTVFEHQAEAVETVVEELEKDGRWQVSGYFIK